MLAKVDEQLKHHVHDVTKLEGFLESNHAAYESFFETLSNDLQTHQTLLRKVEIESAFEQMSDGSAAGDHTASPHHSLITRGVSERDGRIWLQGTRWACTRMMDSPDRWRLRRLR